MYEVDYALLKKLTDPSKLDPKTIKVFGFPTGMLPQANATPRAEGLQELAIHVEGEADGKFNSGDKIIFYGQGPDAYQYLPQKDFFAYEKNLYSKQNFYFITFAGAQGKRLSTLANEGTSHPVINSFVSFVTFEEDTESVLNSGREWFGFQFSSTNEATIEFGLTGILPNTTVTLASRVMARAFEPASFKVFFNGTQVGTQTMATVPNTTYGAKGRMRSDTLTFSSSAVGADATSTHRIKYVYEKSGTLASTGFLDGFVAGFTRALKVYDNQTEFSLASTQPVSTVEIASAQQAHVVWDVTDLFQAKSQTISLTGDKIQFGSNLQLARKFIVFSPKSTLLKPKWAGAEANQNLRQPAVANLLIVAHPDFLEAAERLAEHRTAHNGITTLVVTPAQIFNDYSGGRQDVSAMRDFIRKVYASSAGQLKNVLLFGRGSYDYLDRTELNTNFVPLYESRNSLSPLETYSSDDFFTFLETHEGEWSEVGPFNHTLDIGIGRIPARTIEEADVIVDKLIDYDLHSKTKGPWRTTIAFVADDGNGNLHAGQANQLAGYVEASNPALTTKKLYLDRYTQVEKVFGQISEEASNQLVRAMHEGAAIINYTGHGSEQLWTDERFLSPTMLSLFKNRYRYPFMVTATCEFGRSDDPFVISSAERLLFLKDAGVVGLVTTSRPVFSSSNFQINSDFYEALLADAATQGKTIGEVFRATKNKGSLGVGNRNFSLVGDPSMTLSLPPLEAIVTLFESAAEETDVKGLTEYTLEGEIRQNEALKADFNGKALIRVHDVPTQAATKGDENPVFYFEEFSRFVYQGWTRVTNGKFSSTFTTPRLENTEGQVGKITVYAQPDEGEADAAGHLQVLLTPTNGTLTDAQPPVMALFMNDTTFVDGGITDESPFLIAKISDNTGIDALGNGSRPLLAVLDNDSTFDVAPYFAYDKHSTKSGRLVFQLFHLSEGNHEITVSGYDLAGNKAEATVHFKVGGQNQLEVSGLRGWPNPFNDKVTIGFFHNRTGEDLEGSITISTVAGQPVANGTFTQESAFFSTQVLVWDGTDSAGQQIPPGVYILRLSVRSHVDGSKKEAFSRLVRLN